MNHSAASQGSDNDQEDDRADERGQESADRERAPDKSHLLLNLRAPLLRSIPMSPACAVPRRDDQHHGGPPGITKSATSLAPGSSKAPLEASR